MTRNFYLNGEKSERVKIVKKKGQQFIVLHAIVEKKGINSFFWNKKYMENFIILPDKLRELKIIEITDFEKINYESFFPNKINVIDYETLNIGDIVYNTHKNYIDREIVRKNITAYAEMINEWDVELDKKIKDIKEVVIEDNDASDSEEEEDS